MAVRAAIGGVVKRREDVRLVTGAGRFTDDLMPDGCLHAVLIRSTIAHARIRAVDVSAALALPGVVAVLLAADLPLKPRAGVPAPEAMARPPLAKDVVRFVGDIVGVAVGETREQAVDAAAAVAVDYEPLPALVDPFQALADGAPSIHADKGDNVGFSTEFGDPGALDGAEVVVRARLKNQRLAAVPIETNCAVAEPDGNGGLRMWVSTQVPFRVRDEVAEQIGLAESQVRVITGDVGGGFGAKLSTYPEHSVVAALARKLGRPVRWVEYRSENMVAMTHGRGQFQDVALGAGRDGRLVGLEADVVADVGAYPGDGVFLPYFTGQMSCGVYDVPRVHFRATAAATNTTAVAAYRGAGRPESTALIERAMDMLALELGVDPADLRRINLHRGDFPYTTATGATYDSGDYARALEEALSASHYEELRREQRHRRERGERIQLGVGISLYVEVTAAVSPPEHGAVRIQPDGTVVIHSGATSSGQGHETAFAQIASSVLDVPIDAVTVIASDTGIVRTGDGSYASRSLQVGGTAVRGACLAVVEKAKEEAARRLEASTDDVVRFEDGRFGVKGVPESALTWAQLASESALAAEEDFYQSDPTYPFGCHVAVVEVDVETGDAKLIRHVAVDDCGTILNRMLVEGQVHGGAAQGVAQALYEEFVYDSDGNPLTTSLVDYGIPTIGEIPRIDTVHTETPTLNNPLGAKGVGESGTIGSTPAVQNAVIDAVSHLGVRHIDMPCHPMRVWEAIQAASKKK